MTLPPPPPKAWRTYGRKPSFRPCLYLRLTRFERTPLLVDSTDEENSLYVLVLIGKTMKGDLMINRTIFFERTTLVMVRQKEYEPNGDILSDTRYKDWHTYGNVSFPGTIDISRPKDGYGVVMNIVKLAMNAGITDDKFVLTQPEGTELHVLGAAPVPKEPGK